ncbi:MAG TPA: VTT domain-containing protein [Candidatus Binatia bacterium]|nr:VTT domain-containing protein [Candidatus Binatia bacterium]
MIQDSSAESAERSAAPAIVTAGRNCRERVHATRVAFLIDANAYFAALVAAVRRAREQVLVIGWDIQATTRLCPGGMPDGVPEDLRSFLNAVVARRHSLRVHLLEWDFSLLFSLERELLPFVQLGWRTHRRVRFRLDANHPLSACHHQKIVVVDDSLAFVGGVDLTTGRWDTPAHAPDEPRRVELDGRPYAPFHDVEMAVEGPAAAALGRLARERWRRATGRWLRGPRQRHDAWPDGLHADMEHVDVAIARTDPAFDGRPAVHEVEALYLDSIAAARRWIYIENQYLTSNAVRDALAERLREPAGPEVVMVLPRACAGWLEESTMGTLRGAFLATLREADRHDRLRVFYPRLTADDEVCLTVHAKVMVVDDVLIRVGSSNLSNRSMGLDTECDLAVEACGRPDVARTIAAQRARLLSEHLATSPEEVAQAIRETGSLIAAIERLRRGGPRTLEPLQEVPAATWLDPDGLASAAIDLERPIEQARFLTTVVAPEVREPLVRSALRTAVVGACLLGASLLWAQTAPPPFDMVSTIVPLHDPAAAALVVAVAFLLGGAFLVPVSGLLLASALVFGPIRGGLYALAGTVTAAGAFYAIGRAMWGRLLRRLTGRYVDRVGRRLAGGRVRSIALVQLLSLAPFTIVNVVAGALRIGVARFLAGTLLGIAPATIAVALIARVVWTRWW